MKMLDIGLGIFEEIIITIIFGVAGYFLGKMRSIIENIRLKHLRNFFGKSAKNPDRIKLIIPILHPIQDLECDIDNNRFKKVCKGEIQEFPGPEDLMATADIKAASNIITLLENLTPHAVEPINDEESLGMWNERCLICIGSPLSNIKAKIVWNELDHTPVSWVDAPSDLYNQRLRLKDGQEFISTKDYDYGLIFKVPNKYSNGDFIFILGGIAHFATIGTARYLRQNWRELDKKSDNGPFFCILKVDTESIERLELVYFEKWDEGR